MVHEVLVMLTYTRKQFETAGGHDRRVQHHVRTHHQMHQSKLFNE